MGTWTTPPMTTGEGLPGSDRHSCTYCASKGTVRLHGSLSSCRCARGMTCVLIFDADCAWPAMQQTLLG